MTVIEVELVKAVGARFPPNLLAQTLERATKVREIAARLPDGECTVAMRITGDAEMERLNREFAGEDHPTDVLSFEGAARHLGDIAISWPAVLRQARRHGHGPRTELALLAVHGFLHLLGWEHATPAEAREMNRLTRALLGKSGLKPARGRL